MKAQDTIPICPSTMSQRVALGALSAGSGWVDTKVASLQVSSVTALPHPLISPLIFPLHRPRPAHPSCPPITLQQNHDMVRACIERALGSGAVRGGTGALYLMVELPTVGEPAGPADDMAVVEWLAREHGVCVIPGTACGLPGSVRVCFGERFRV